MTAKLNFKRALSLLLPVIILATGCKDMKLDIQDSKDRLDALEGTTITTINEQITAINSSITDLQSMDKTLDGYINTLETTAKDLQKQIDDANAEIAKVESELGEEITALEQRLLNELNSAKEAIQAELATINKTLDNLKTADAALDKKIAELQTYVDTELASAKDWANATFSTLTQYEQTQTEISGIKASIEQINADIATLETRLNDKIAADIKTAIDALRTELNTDHALRIESAVNNLTVAYTAAVSSARSEITTAYTNAISNAIIESESGMKAWINSKLAQGYYDIATIDGKLEALSGRLEEADEELQKQIDQQKSDLETAKSELTSAYKKAIEDAISSNNGVICAEIAGAILKLEAKINTHLSTIESQITAMQKGINEIIDDIDTIQKQIESINATLQTHDDKDGEFASLIDEIEKSYADLLAEFQTFRQTDEASKEKIITDIASLQELIDIIQDRLLQLEADFVNMVQSLKYVPEYSDRIAMISDLKKCVSLDFLVTPMSQANILASDWQQDKSIIRAYLRYTKSPDTRAVGQAVPLTVVSVSSSESGLLSVTLCETVSSPLSKDFLAGGCPAVIYLHISDGNTEILSDFVDIKIFEDEISTTDLSPLSDGKYQTANCYIVSTAGTYCFKAFKGNSQELAGAVHEDHPEGTISEAVVLWETFGTDVTPSVGDLIKSVSYQGNDIVFQTADIFKEGNAVIAAKDSDGNILWSWHIWLTDLPDGQEYYNYAGTMMDRNLGATSATPGDVGTLGLLYQWGRKDPFLNSYSIWNEIFAKSTINWTTTSSNISTGTIIYATKNPTMFIKYNSHNYDWYYTGAASINETRWALPSGDKSIYDPCPASWRIPRDGVWRKAEGSSYSYIYTYDSVNGGMNFSGKFGSDTTIWYPASGYRHYDGSFYGVGGLGWYWSSTTYNKGAMHLHFDNDGEVWPSHTLYNSLANGYSVRCVLE